MPRRGAVTVRDCEALGERAPCVCVKVPPLYHRLSADVRGKDPHDYIYNLTAEDWWDSVPHDLVADFLRPDFSDCEIEVRQDGWSGGWLCVGGIGLPDEWSPDQAAAWADFARRVRQSVGDYVQVYVANVRANLPPSRLATEAHARCEGSRTCREHAEDRRVPSCKRRGPGEER